MINPAYELLSGGGPADRNVLVYMPNRVRRTASAAAPGPVTAAAVLPGAGDQAASFEDERGDLLGGAAGELGRHGDGTSAVTSTWSDEGAATVAGAGVI